MDHQLTELPALQQLINNPKTIAIVDGDTGSTWEDIFRGALEVVAHLSSCGLKPGDHAAI